MSAINQLREELAYTEAAQFVTTMLRDISATKLQSIRAAYEANEKYFMELHTLTQLLQDYAASKNIALPKTNKKSVLVAVTSNRRFYGTLNDDVITRLQKSVSEEGDADCLIIGQTGLKITERIEVDAHKTFTTFEKDEPTPEEIFAVVKDLAAYSKVQVIHPTYINAFEQNAKVTDVTHIPEPGDVESREVLEYLFEPDIPAMIAFFTTQIRLVLFDRIILETRLALTGARLMKMQRAR
jgi:F0F1-type ATP synthase gamma subunit